MPDINARSFVHAFVISLFVLVGLMGGCATGSAVIQDRPGSSTEGTLLLLLLAGTTCGLLLGIAFCRFAIKEDKQDSLKRVRRTMVRHRNRLVRDPDNSVLHWFLGNGHCAVDEWDDARAEWLKAAELDPEGVSGTAAREQLNKHFSEE